jgi:hypothetical protein
MDGAQKHNTFYFKMGLLLTVLVIIGFGSAMIKGEKSPLDLPLLFHIHALVYMAWFLLFILQTKLISHHKYNLHKNLGYSSIFIVIAMLVTGFLMSITSYERGTSPVPGTTIEQFMSFPLLDLSGLFIFYLLGILNRSKAMTHKHCMLICSIAIMDPAIARLGMSLGVPPLILLIHIGLVALVMIYDKRSAGKIHFITWMGLAFIILRLAFIFTIGGTEAWASLMNSIYG